MKVACKSCNYRFESDLNYENKPCPYCGEKAVQKEKSADDLLGEID